MKRLQHFAFSLLSFVLISCGGAGTESGDPKSEKQDTQEKEMTLEEAKAARLEVPAGARVFFANINDGDTVSSPVHIEMGVEGMGVEPAGEVVDGTGHHHILINNATGFLEAGAVVPMDSLNLHYGKGQTEADVELAPGDHTLSLQFANGLHESYGRSMSATINIVVQ